MMARTNNEIYDLRKNVYDFSSEFIKPLVTGNTLEVGPAIPSLSPEPSLVVPIRDYVTARGGQYSSVDRMQDPNLTYSCDMLDLDTKQLKNTFNSLIALEVLEHTTKIWEVPKLWHTLLKPGGQFFVTTPFKFIWHSPKPDLWRISPDGFELLFSDLFDLNIVAYCDGNIHNIVTVGVVGRKK